MNLPIYWIDAFTRLKFCGNPAAVIPLETWLSDRDMQLIAFENGLAETAFFIPTGPREYHLRWFTPEAEVDLCGHATLASAFTLFQHLGLEGDLISFQTRSGELRVMRGSSSPERSYFSRHHPLTQHPPVTYPTDL